MEHVKVDGMTCSNCALKVSDKLRETGLEQVVVEHATGRVQFDNPKSLTEDRIATALKNIGFSYKGKVDEKAHTGFRPSPLQVLFGSSLLLTVPLWAMMFSSWHLLHSPWFQFTLTTPVFGIGVWYFGRSAFNAMHNGTTNMDVLIMLGTTAAYAYSLIEWTTQPEPVLYFETTASIITIVLGGNLLEAFAVSRAGRSLQHLQELQPETAQVITGSGEELQLNELPAKSLLAGDKIRVRPGERVPADGSVISGEVQCDESLLTGESDPVRRGEGERVVAGATVINGSADVKVTAAGKQSTLSSIIDRVHSARADKPAVQQLSDRISAWFVPVVVFVAIGTLGVCYFAMGLTAQESIIRAVAVLVVACPCALGLATPTSVAVGIGIGARNGIVVRRAQAMQQWLEADMVVFDKTGTLTTGTPRVADIDYHTDDHVQVNRLLYSIEQHSAHPVAKAVVQHFKGEQSLDIQHIIESAGLGVYGTYDDATYFIGKSEAHGDYDSVLLKGNALLAGLRFEESVKSAAQGLITRLKAKGKTVMIASGDREPKVAHAAMALDIETYYAGVSPEEKQALVREFQSASKTVAMVGDGVNDAPALAQANVSVSLNGGLKLAADAADIVLLPADLAKLEPLERLSRLTVRNIRQNLGWVFLYNGLAIPFAAAGFLTPIIAAALMAGSDIVVILNALRLRLRL